MLCLISTKCTWHGSTVTLLTAAYATENGTIHNIMEVSIIIECAAANPVLSCSRSSRVLPRLARSAGSVRLQGNPRF
jgi:hypothetical protein